MAHDNISSCAAVATLPTFYNIGYPAGYRASGSFSKTLGRYTNKTGSSPSVDFLKLCWLNAQFAMKKNHVNKILNISDEIHKTKII